MRTLLWLLLALSVMIFSAEPVAAQRKASKQTHKTSKAKKTRKKVKSIKAVKAAPEEASPPAGSIPFIEETEFGAINWTEQYIEAEGEATQDNERYKNPEQAHALALRAAADEARQNLLDLIKDIFVTPTATVEDLITANAGLDQQIHQLVAIAAQTELPRESKGTVHLRLRLPIYAQNGLASALAPLVPSENLEGISAQNEKLNLQESGFKGVVVKTHGIEIQLALFPTLADSAGHILFDTRSIYRPDIGKFPKMYKGNVVSQNKYADKMRFAELNVTEIKNGSFVLTSSCSRQVDWVKAREAAIKSPPNFFQFL